MVGTILNGAAIVVGGILGKTVAKDLSLATQKKLKMLLGFLVVYVGLSTTWGAINGSFGQVMKQLFIALLALVIGNIVGKLLRLQTLVNKAGHYASLRFKSTKPEDENRFSEGFITCTLLFCIGPMAILGALQDGLSGSVRTLAIKSVMDGLATMAFVKTFGWGPILSAVPVVAFQGTITLAANGLEPYLRQQSLLDSVNATGGLLICCISLIILDLKKVPIADYLPSLLVAPLLARWWQ